MLPSSNNFTVAQSVRVLGFSSTNRFRTITKALALYLVCPFFSLAGGQRGVWCHRTRILSGGRRGGGERNQVQHWRLCAHHRARLSRGLQLSPTVQVPRLPVLCPCFARPLNKFPRIRASSSHPMECAPLPCCSCCHPSSSFCQPPPPSGCYLCYWFFSAVDSRPSSCAPCFHR